MLSFRTNSRRSFLTLPLRSVALGERSSKRQNNRITRAVSSVIEPLENRTLMSTVVVNSISDTATGTGVVTLRDAVSDANSSSTPTNIIFDPTVFATPQTITLSGSKLELSNTGHATTITGPAGGVTISGNDASRVFTIDTGVTVGMTNVTITDGNCVNDADQYGYFIGGGIDNINGFLTMTNCAVTNCMSGGAGGIQSYPQSGTVNLTDVTISDNSGGTSAPGGINCTGSKLTNVTIVGNTAALSGGGFAGKNDTLIGCTITGNTAGVAGGGLFVNALTLNIGNTIIAGNTCTAGSPDVGVNNTTGGTITSLGHNLIGKTDGTTGWISSDLTGTIASPLNANLGTLASNGGLTQTELPLAGSPALAAGSVTLIPTGDTTDQRGYARTFNGTVDIGSVEQESTTAAATSVLEFATQPSNVSGGSLGTITVDVDSSAGGIVTADESNVTLSLAAGTSGATLGGTTTVAAVNGVATFSGLTLGGAGTGLTLIASDGSLSPVASSPFNASDATTIVVNTTSDTATGSGIMTLRDAITTANASTRPTAITFDPTVFTTAQTITLGGTELELTNTAEPITITGPSAGLTVSGNNASRVLQVDAGVTASLSGLTITGGDTTGNGGGILNLGSLTIGNATITGNKGAEGGGINNAGKLTMSSDTVSSNTGSGRGGGVGNDGTNGDAIASLTNVTISDNTSSSGGGGISSVVDSGVGSTTLTLNTVTVEGNVAAGNGGGVLLDQSDTGTSLSGGALTDNKAGFGGGGLYSFSGATYSLTNVTVSGNSAATAVAGTSYTAEGGGLFNDGTATLTGVTVSGNSVATNPASTAYPNGQGGGIFNQGTMNFQGGTVTGNTSGQGGGGIHNSGTITVANSSLTSNVAQLSGGGGFNSNPGILNPVGNATLTDVTISGNSAPDGAGVSCIGYTQYSASYLTLDNVTVTGNTASGSGGGVYLDGNDNMATLVGDTITGNAASTDSGGLRNGGDSIVSVANTIIAANTVTGTAATSPDASGTISSQGYNLIGATDGSTGWVTTDLTGTAASPLSAGLGTLANNGGPTETLLPLAGSPAIANGSVSLIPSGVTTDQRGDARTINGSVDIGAVEVGGTRTVFAPQATTITLVSNATSLEVGQQCTFTVTVTPVNGSTTAPTGTVTIFEDGVNKGTGTLGANGVAILTWTADGSGDATATQGVSTSIDAVYNGDSNYASSTSSPITMTYFPASTATAKITIGKVPPTAIAGQPFASRLGLTVTNKGTVPLAGNFAEVLYLDAAAATEGLTTDPIQLISILRRTTLRIGRSLAVSFATRLLPASVTAGAYHLVAKITDPDGNVDLVTLSDNVQVAAPVVTLSASVAAVRPATVKVNRFGSAVLTVTNTGNINATGTMYITLNLSPDGVTPAAGFTPVTTKVRVNIRPGKFGKFAVRIKIPATLAAGTYYPLVTASLNGISTSAVGSLFTAG